MRGPRTRSYGKYVAVPGFFFENWPPRETTSGASKTSNAYNENGRQNVEYRGGKRREIGPANLCAVARVTSIARLQRTQR